jgi:hypothetical protein
MGANAILNVDTPNLHIAEYDWGEMPAEVPVAEADVILAADCVYFEVRPCLPPNPTTNLASREKSGDPILLEEKKKGMFSYLELADSRRIKGSLRC